MANLAFHFQPTKKKERFSTNWLKTALFILGQLYRQENHINRSQETFQELIDYRKAPYKYKVYAEIEKVKNHPQGNDATEVIERLNKLISIRENRPYLL